MCAARSMLSAVGKKKGSHRPDPVEKKGEKRPSAVGGAQGSGQSSSGKKKRAISNSWGREKERRKSWGGRNGAGGVSRCAFPRKNDRALFHTPIGAEGEKKKKKGVADNTSTKRPESEKDLPSSISRKRKKNADRRHPKNRAQHVASEHVLSTQGKGSGRLQHLTLRGLNEERNSLVQQCRVGNYAYKLLYFRAKKKGKETTPSGSLLARGEKERNRIYLGRDKGRKVMTKGPTSSFHISREERSRARNSHPFPVELEEENLRKTSSIRSNLQGKRRRL